MTLYEFNVSDEQEQAEAVWDGVHIAEREDSEHKILLYQINGKETFYVEVYYHKEYEVIRKFRSFKSPNQLEPYTKQIDLVKLLNS